MFSNRDCDKTATAVNPASPHEYSDEYTSTPYVVRPTLRKLCILNQRPPYSPPEEHNTVVLRSDGHVQAFGGNYHGTGLSKSPRGL